jgi:hypothetical protein
LPFRLEQQQCGEFNNDVDEEEEEEEKFTTFLLDCLLACRGKKCAERNE